MYQFLKFLQPIPSCGIHSLEFNNGVWTFIYALNTPFELTNENEQELIIYEYISDLHLKLPDAVHPESVNLKVKTLDEYLAWLDKQIAEDIRYRNEWLAQEKNKNAKPNVVTLENRSYTHEELMESGVNFISAVVNQDEQSTTFAAV